MQERDRAVRIFDILEMTYPGAGPTINFSNPFELLVAAILGARATDESVNRTTAHLFAEYPGPAELARADYDALVREIHDVGLAEPKARYLIETAAILLEEYGGRVPCSMDDLLGLPGVGRKVANMVLGAGCGVPAMIVDTHVNRVSHRLGLTTSTNPAIAERELKEVLPEDRWTRWNFLMIAHGRRTCTARNPKHMECPVLRLCPYGLARTPSILLG
ncbi:MAG: endonuclease III [Armatimonadota bacterium]